MTKYIIRRLMVGAVSLFALIIIVFVLSHVMPGSPFTMDNITQEAQDRINAFYGLDKPIHVQLGLYLGNLLRGNFGVSFKRVGTSVNQLIAMEAPLTIRIGVLAFAVALILGTILGILMAVTHKESVKGGLMVLTILGISIPNYVFALMLMLIFGMTFKVLPVVGLDSWRHYILPVTTLTVYPLAQISKLVRSSFSEALSQDYVVMARAKGLDNRRIMFVHVLKNAMIPVVTISGPMIAFLLTGSFVVENIFTIPGIGREFVNAVGSRDYTVIMGLTIFLGIVLMICNLIADIVCAFIDPRIKVGK